VNKIKLLKIFNDFLAKADEPYKRYHRIADKMAPSVRKDFLKAIAKAQKDIDLGKLEKALKAGNFKAAENLIDWAAFGLALNKINQALAQVFKEAAKVAGKTFLPDIGITQSLTLSNIEAEKWIAQNAAQLITNVGEETKKAIKEIILRGQKDGIAPKKTAKEIRNLIGLTDRDARAVQNFKARLEIGNKFTPEQVDKQVAKYYQKKLKERAETIAINETQIAAKEGNRAILDQALKENYINTAEWERRWLTTPDDRRCDRCLAMHGQITELDKPYSSGDMTPHLHIKCRCSESIQQKKGKK